MGEWQKKVSSPLQVFYSYAREDEKLCMHLEKHLSLLQSARSLCLCTFLGPLYQLGSTGRRTGRGITRPLD